MSTKLPGSIESHPSDDQSSILDFPVVGIGASAGGLEAFLQLLKSLPADIGMSFIFIQHLDPNFPSSLAEILASQTKLKVVVAEDGVKIESGTIYVQPADKCVKLVGQQLELSPRDKSEPIPILVDDFLQSLADSQKENSIAIILSGLGADGSVGVQHIHERGGIVFAQEEKSCKFSSMPVHAIATGTVDFTLPPSEIGKELVRIKSHWEKFKGKNRKDLLAPDYAGGSDLGQLLNLIASRFGTDFSNYKKTTIERRIFRRMDLKKVTSLSDYIEFLRSDPAEVEALYNDLLIRVTKFFRNPGVFQAIEDKIFPYLLKNKTQDKPLRIWVPACSTGEEVYSLAILLMDFLKGQGQGSDIEVQIFGTDISENAIQKARKAIYPDVISSEISPERLRRYFLKVDQGFQIKKNIRDICIFAVQDVIKDPPFSRIDLISCRNLFIYFESSLQKRVLHTLHYGLKPNGVLLMGASENPNKGLNFFRSLDNKNRIYLKEEVKNTNFISSYNAFQDLYSVINEKKKVRPLTSQEQVFRQADLMILNRLSPVGILIDKKLNILQIRGNASQFLVPPMGLPSYNLLKMARMDLRTPIHTVFMNAIETQKVSERNGVQVNYDGVFKKIDIKVLPFRANGTQEDFYIVSMEETGETPKVLNVKRSKTEAQKIIEQKDEEIQGLQHQLSELQSHLQASIEEFETTNEELNASNEEVLSSNEELQSTNEELQTSKEEIQSANEELSTLNNELQNRNDEVAQVSDDLENLLNSTGLSVILVGADLCIRKYTHPATKLLRIIPTDIGRPIRDVRPLFQLPDMEKHISEVIDTVQSVKIELQDDDGYWYSMSILPYRTIENQIDGAVILFEDIHERKINSLKDHQLATVLRDSNDAIILLDKSGVIKSWNRGAQRMYGYSEEEALELHFKELVPAEYQKEALDFLNLNKNVETFSFETKRITKDLKVIDVQMTLTPLKNDKEAIEFLSLIERDITERKANEEKYIAFLDSAPTPMVIINEDGDVQLINSQMENLFGYKKEEIIGQKIEVLIPDRFKKEHPFLRNTYTKSPVFRKLNTGKDLFGLLKDGTEIPIDISLNPVQTSDGLLISASVVDITERTQKESFLKIAMKEAESANLAKSNFLANMSHEIRTPLAAIIGFTDLLRKIIPEENKEKTYLEKIYYSGSHLRQLIDDILDLAKIESGKMEVENRDFPFIEELGSLFSVFESLAKSKRIDFEVHFGDNLPLFINSDAFKIRQILNNIVGNAIKFTSAGRIDVYVRLADSSDIIEILVKDTGSGIDHVGQEIIFDPFTQAEAGTTRKFGGTGLGLNLSRKLSRSLGGDIVLLESQPQKGSSFLITIKPESMSELVENQNPSIQDQIECFEKLKKQFSGARVLVAEDEQNLRDLLEVYLGKFGIEVSFAVNGKDAIEMSKIGDYQLIFMDIQMSETDGYQATKAIRDQGIKPPIVALTARLMKGEQKKCLDAGCVEVIPKPYSFEQILNVLKKYLK